MNREEIMRYIKDLKKDATIIICKSSEDIPISLRSRAERLIAGNKIFLFLRNSVGLVIVVWVTFITLAPEWIPTAPQVIKHTLESGKYLLSKIDFSFPHSENDDKPFIVFEGVLPSGDAMPDVKYVIPTSGLDLYNT